MTQSPSQQEYLTCLEAPDNVQMCLRNVSKVFSSKTSLLGSLFGSKKSDFVALENINLDIEHNTFVTIIGPSGCGKSTLLNIIAGLSFPTEGSIMMDKEPIRGARSRSWYGISKLCSYALDDCS